MLMSIHMYDVVPADVASITK